MTGLPTTSHVQAFLRVHMEAAAYDAAHSEENGHGPLGQRYSLWQSCINHLELLESNAAYAAHFADLVMRHSIATVHAGDPAAYRAALAEVGLGAEPGLGLRDHRFDDAPGDFPTARAFAVADYLQAQTPELRFGSWHLSADDVSCMFVGHTPDDTARAWLRMAADRFDLRYSEDAFRGDQIECMATGTIGGIAVKFHQLVTADPDAPRTESWATSDVSAKIDARVRQSLIDAAALQAIPTLPVASWAISYGDISGLVRRPDIDASRAAMQRIADEHGYAYAEEPRPSSGPHAVYIHASSRVDGIPVRFWDIRDEIAAPPVAGPVDDGGALNDFGRDVAEEAAVRAEVAAEGSEGLAAEDGLDEDADAYTDAELDGHACVSCGEPFVDVVTQEAGEGPNGVLFMHADPDDCERALEASVPEVEVRP